MATLPRHAEAAAAASDQLQWLHYRQRFVTPEGRVVDTGNGGVSHSEGQGYGLLLAEAFDDKACFDCILGWTRQELLRPEGLHAWRFRPGLGVDDPNNATDGDLYIAWALLRASERWGRPDYERQAMAIAQAVVARLVLEIPGRTLLLPGRLGFSDDRRVVLNPSYYAFPAMAALGRMHRHPAWAALQRDGVSLLREARFGRWGLPADWVEVARSGTRQAAPARGRNARFSYDAVRVPLHLAWAGLSEEPGLAAARHFWQQPGNAHPPAWVDLRSGERGTDTASTGVMAIASLAQQSGRGRTSLQDMPRLNTTEDYYPASLTLLARIAAQEAPHSGNSSATQPLPAPGLGAKPAPAPGSSLPMAGGMSKRVAG